MAGRARRPVGLPGALVVALSSAIPLAAQSVGEEAPVDTAGLAPGAFSTMEMLYERTIFGLDVLRLTLRFGPETTRELQRLAASREPSDALADSVAAVAVDSRDALVRSRFLRDVSFEDWMDGIRRNLSRAREAGFLELSDAAFRGRIRELRRRYGPLEERGLEEGDVVWYRIRGDTVEVKIQGRDGAVLVEESPVGPTHRRSVLGGYLAPGSDFREDLVRSLFRREGG